MITGLLTLAGVVVGALIVGGWSAPDSELVDLLWPRDRRIDTTAPTTTEINTQEQP